MLSESRTSLHFGVNAIFAPQPVLDAKHRLTFLGELANRSLDFAQVVAPTSGTWLLKRPTPPLDVKLTQPGPPIGQLVVLASGPARTLDDFITECEDVVAALAATWPGNLQVLQRDCKIQHLYDVAAEHAFQYLWEKRLRASGEELKVLGRSVSGGGLRLVMPAPAGERDAPQIQVRVESYLRNPRKLLVEVHMTWHPTPGQTFDAGAMLRECESYAEGQVVAFIGGGK